MKVAYWRADPCLRNETAPPCIMLKQTSDPCPGLASRFPGPHTFPAGRAVLPWRYLRSAPGLLARSGSKVFYSVFITPISEPQCPHFIMKSGYRPFFGVIICVFVPDTASMIRRPHTGQQTGRRVVLSPLVCASFFLRISYTPLSVAAAVRRGRVYDLL